MKRHPDFKWDKVTAPKVTTRPHQRDEKDEHKVALDYRRAAQETEKNRREQTLKYWRTKDKDMVTKLKAYWAERDKLTKTKLRLNDYTCDTCNRPFATVRKIPRGKVTRCPPCTRAVRSQQKRASYYRHREEIRAKQNEYFPTWYARQPKAVRTDPSYKIPIIPDQWTPPPGPGPRVVWQPQSEI